MSSCRLLAGFYRRRRVTAKAPSASRERLAGSGVEIQPLPSSSSPMPPTCAAVGQLPAPPPGTSKWNKVEHRLFYHITQNWRGRPLVNYTAIVQLIGKTTTRAGLQVRAELDEPTYVTKEKVTQEQLARVRLKPAAFCGEWNYTVVPN